MFKNKMILLLLLVIFISASAYGCSFFGIKSYKVSNNKDENKTTTNSKMSDSTNNENINYETAILAGGCFWCVETIFQDIKGVEKVESGYSGGTVKNPSYQEVCTGNTGHAEAIKITFDSTVLSFEKLLIVFFHVHNPTTLNKQGADVGTQYRSAIFYMNDDQKKTAEKVIADITASKLWDDPIVTVVTKFDNFYKAEDYHQDYYNNNPNQGYCSYVIAPKVKKFYKEFPELLKENVK